MAVGKNKRLTKGGKKGAKKKVVDPFSKKDWYDVKAPAMFNIRNIGKTLVTSTQGTKIASDGLKGRVFEVSLADLQNDEVAFRRFKLITEDVQGKNCLTNFHGMDLTRDKMCSMVKKWQTMIEAHVDVKTTDGYLLRLFCVGFTKKRSNQIRKTSYAQHQQILTDIFIQAVMLNEEKVDFSIADPKLVSSPELPTESIHNAQAQSSNVCETSDINFHSLSEVQLFHEVPLHHRNMRGARASHAAPGPPDLLVTTERGGGGEGRAKNREPGSPGAQATDSSID
ncbi:hypothetical protein H8959_000592 [Pygathrix nigripes]